MYVVVQHYLTPKVHQLCTTCMHMYYSSRVPISIPYVRTSTVRVMYSTVNYGEPNHQASSSSRESHKHRGKQRGLQFVTGTIILLPVKLHGYMDTDSSSNSC